ncbi:MAG: HAD family phosphatase [Oscillospiraceae bacterium]|nr:HAD family phosphatase [Oscillospiraceae bacterium]
MAVGLVLLDLDGTMLTSDKEISPATYAALERAAAMGVQIVPCTGRFYDAIPRVVRELPFVRYFITVNGAGVWDRTEEKMLFRAEIPLERGLELFDFMEKLPVIYDCFVDGAAYMERKNYDRIDQFISVPKDNEMVKTLRKPVDDLRRLVREKGQPLQKAQMFFADVGQRNAVLPQIRAQIPDLNVSTSLVNNIEFTVPAASKGEALRFLAAHLGVVVADTMAFGDMDNDRSMIEAAGIGVAMGNAEPCLKDIADYITDTNNADGVAKALEKFVFA